MSVQTSQAEMVTQAWEASHRPLEYELGHRLMELAGSAQHTELMPPQRRPRRTLSESVVDMQFVEPVQEAAPAAADALVTQTPLVRFNGQYRVLEADGTLGDTWGGVGRNKRFEAAKQAGRAVDLGEYGSANWTAQRHKYQTPGGVVRPVKAPA